MIKIIFDLFDSVRKKNFLIIIFLVLIGTLIEILALANIYKLIEVLIVKSEQIYQIKILQKIIVFENISLISFLTLSLILIFLIKFIFFTFLSHFQFQFIYNFRHSISKKLLSKYLNSKYLFIISKNSSELVRNVDKEASIFADGVLLNLISIITEVVILIGILSFLIIVNLKSTIFVLFILISLFLVFFLFFRKRIYNYGKTKQIILADFLKNILQALRGIKDIKIYNKENFFEKVFSISSKKLSVVSTKLMFIYSLTRYSIELVVVLSAGVFIFYSLNLNTNIDDILVSIGLYAAAAFRVIPSLNKIIGSAQRLVSSKPSINLIYDQLTNIEPEKKIENNNTIFFNEKILFKDISFSYHSSRDFSLKKINFEINKFETLAIIGKSGSGKSTLVDIISGLIEPSSGEIQVDKKISTNEYFKIRQNVSYLSQNFFLIDDTILKNIVFDDSENEVDLKRVNELIIELELESLIRNSKNGIYSHVGEGGVQLSGGQSQRVALARCFYSNKDIIILDEATSALDINTENSILNLIKSIKLNKTIILVSHRKNVLEFADRVLMLDDGKVIK